MPLRDHVESGRLQVVVLSAIGVTLLAMSLAEVPLFGIEPETLPTLAAVAFATTAPYLNRARRCAGAA
jgi:hypothetical protein